jgi:hypothetical protein
MSSSFPVPTDRLDERLDLDGSVVGQPVTLSGDEPEMAVAA